MRLPRFFRKPEEVLDSKTKTKLEALVRHKGRPHARQVARDNELFTREEIDAAIDYINTI